MLVVFCAALGISHHALSLTTRSSVVIFMGKQRVGNYSIHRSCCRNTLHFGAPGRRKLMDGSSACTATKQPNALSHVRLIYCGGFFLESGQLTEWCQCPTQRTGRMKPPWHHVNALYTAPALHPSNSALLAGAARLSTHVQIWTTG